MRGERNVFADKLAKSSLQKEITVPVLLGNGEEKTGIKRKGVRHGRKDGRRTRKEGDISEYKSRS